MIDFLVIGAGIAGLSAAGRICEFGKTLVLEAEDNIAYHASSRSAALFEMEYGKPAVIALNKAGEEFFETFDGGVLSPRGFMLMGQDGDDAAFDHDFKNMNLSEISLDDARSMIPILSDTITRAAHSPSARDIDTDRLMQAFVKHLRKHGGDVKTKCPVTDITRTPNGWAVTAGGEVIEAKTLLNAAGAWVDQIAQMAGIAPLGFTPLRRSVARIAAPGGQDVSRWPMVFGPGETWYAKPDAGALIVSPANETPSDPVDAWPTDMELAEGLASYQDYVTEPVTRPIASWAGLRTFSPDRVLVLGRAPQDHNFIWVAGQGGYGFQTCAAASALVADIIAERPPAMDAGTVAQLCPSRFSSSV